MWERLVELVLFNRTHRHRQPGQILKTFIKTDDTADTREIAPDELVELRRCFGFLDKCYKETELGSTRLARDVPHFYTMVTTLLSSDLLEADGAPPDFPTVRTKLLAFAKLLPDGVELPEDDPRAEPLEKYKSAAVRQTTHPGQRQIRQQMLLEIVDKP